MTAKIIQPQTNCCMKKESLFLILLLTSVLGLFVIIVSTRGYGCKTATVTTPSPPKQPLCSGFGGGIGNLMFQFASGYAIAKETGRQFKFYDNSAELKRIHNAFDVKTWTGGENCKTTINERGWGIYDDISRLPLDKSVYFCCYLQSWKYFIRYTDDIKRIFQFKNETRQKAFSVLKQISSKYLRKIPKVNETHTNSSSDRLTESDSSLIQRVAIHVRLKDGYKDLPNKQFITRAMDYFRSKLRAVVFVIVSDDVPRCKKGLAEFELQYSTCPDRECDLALLTLSDAIIASRISTFSWWAGFLSRKELVYDKNAKSRNDPAYIPADYNLPYWVAL